MHQSQERIILRHTLETLWRHVFLLFTTSAIFFSFVPPSVSQSVDLPAIPSPTGDGRAIKSLAPGLILSKGCGHRQVCVGVVLYYVGLHKRSSFQQQIRCDWKRERRLEGSSQTWRLI